MLTSLGRFLLLVTCLPAMAQTLVPHPLTLPNGKFITLTLPAPFTVEVVATGLHRPRFFTRSPDNRIFLTDMYDLSDNQRGAIYILGGRNSAPTSYLTGLHNPNNLAFYTDPAGQTWLYTALTDKLVRYRYKAGDNAPTSAPETLATFPAFGLNYKYGGWHLTRTVVFANLHGKTSLYIAVGSSCNACQEKEPVRATLLQMNPDGSNEHPVAAGLRNAVDVEYIPQIDGGSLFATNMGDDHLGDRAPEDQFFELDSNREPGPITQPNANYGWPTCYFEGGTPHPDPLVSSPKPSDHVFPPMTQPTPAQFDCSKVPPAYTTFMAHSSPLGLAYFDAANRQLKDTFLVALHGAGHPSIGTGYRVVRFSPGTHHPQNFILGFLTTEAGKPMVHGRPCGLLQTGPDSFLLTDDLNGVIYSVHPN